MHHFKRAGFAKDIILTNDDMELLYLICNLGFVNSNQLDLLYSVTHHKQTVLAVSILQKWTSYSSILHKYKKANSGKRLLYAPTVRCRQFLIQNGYDVEKQNVIQRNSHNEEAIEVVVQSLYAATFSSLSFGTSIPYYQFKDYYVAINNPDKLIRYDVSENMQTDIKRIQKVNQPELTKFVNRLKLSDKSTGSPNIATSANTKPMLDDLTKIAVPYTPTTFSKATTALCSSLVDGTLTKANLNNILVESNLISSINTGNNTITDTSINPIGLSGNNDISDLSYPIENSPKDTNDKQSAPARDAQDAQNNKDSASRESHGQKTLFGLLNDGVKIKSSPFVLQGNTEHYNILQGNTAYYNILQGNTQINLVIHFKFSEFLTGTMNASILPVTAFIALLTMEQSQTNRINVTDLDLRSFMSQYHYENYTFQADEVISFKRANRRQEVFVELDNRSENNRTQIQKILNYINYAFQHPQRDILMTISITDGSLATKKVKKYTNVGKKLANLSQTFLDSYVITKDGKKQYLADLYEKATNLEIVITGVSESNIDIAEFLLGSNYSMDYLHTINSYVAKLNKHSQWKVEFEPSEEFSTILDNPSLANNSLNDITKISDICPISTDLVSGIWRYVDVKTPHPLLGHLHYKNKLSRDELFQPIIAGKEHSLDTVLDITRQLKVAKEQKDVVPPVVIYPTRKHPVSSIVLKSFSDGYNLVSDHWRANIPVSIEPLQTIDDNFELHADLREVINQHSTAFYNYFKIGAITKAALRKNTVYKQEYLNPLKLSVNPHPRSFNELHELALKLIKKDFIEQLKLNEIPIGVFRDVLSRRATNLYSVPVISKLPYLDVEDHQQKYDVFDYVYAMDGIYMPSRTKLNIPTRM